MAGLDEDEEISLSTMFEAVGARKANLIDDAKLKQLENDACPGCGSCSNVYSKFHELLIRGIGHSIARKRNYTRCSFRTNKTSQACGECI